MFIYRKQLTSGLYIRKFDAYINADTSGDHSSTNDDPSRLSGNLDSSWSGEGALTQVTITVNDIEGDEITDIQISADGNAFGNPIT